MLNSSESIELNKKAKDLFKAKKTPELEKLFTKNLKSSYCPEFWSTYLEYILHSNKKVSLKDVYSFILNHFEHYYDNYGLIKDYISLLSKEEDFNKAEKIRKVYQRFLRIPQKSLGRLFQDYQAFENGINKMAASSNVEAVAQGYQNALNLYQKLSPYLDQDNYFKIIDIETENNLKLNKKNYENRMNFVFNFFKQKKIKKMFLENCFDLNFVNDSLNVLHSFYLDVSPEKCPSTLTSFYFSFFLKKNLFNFEDQKNFNITVINYFNYLIKFENIEIFREKFSYFNSSYNLQPQVFMYAAEVEYFHGKSKANAYTILINANNKFSKNSLFVEFFFNLFLGIDEEENIRQLFKILNKTEKMYDLMIRYEFHHGDFNIYKDLLSEKNTAIQNKELLKPVLLQEKPVFSIGSKGIFEQISYGFSYYDLKINNCDVCIEFLKELPVLEEKENIFKNINIESLIKLINSI